ncbi:HEAT repeat domain-containing protein [Candidatus Poribacteria bacterium]|nr:HEAT repeat domain-containing protein [Candidatus Poribacteria bacterium]
MRLQIVVFSLFLGLLIFLITSRYCAGDISTNELVQLMDKKDWTTSRFVAELAVERGAEAIPPLIDMLQHGDEIARDNAMMAIRKLKDPRAIPVLIELLAYKDFKRGGGWLTAVSASETLEEFGEEAVEPLLKVLKEKSGNIRRMVVTTLGEIDDEKALQALQEIFLNRNDPHWEDAALYLAGREDDIGYSVFKLAEKDEKLREIVSKMLTGHRDDKRFLSFYFEKVKSENEELSRDGMLGIARNAGKEELPRIFAEGLDKTWVLPFVEINAVIEGIEPEFTKADILWRFVISPSYEEVQSDGRMITYNFYAPPEETNHIRYAIEKLANLGDVALPLIKGVISTETEVGRRAMAVLARMPPSEASTNLMLETLNSVHEVDMHGAVIELIESLGKRKEKRAVPRLIGLLRASDSNLYGPVVEALNDIGDKASLELLLERLLELWREERGYSIMIAKVLNHWKIADASFIPMLIEAALSRTHGDGPYGALYDYKLAAFLTFVRIGTPSTEALKQLAEPKDGVKITYGDRVTHELAKTALEILK